MISNMEQADYYLLIDVGTGSSRVALVDENRNIYDIQHIKNVYSEDAHEGMLIDYRLFINNLAIASRRVLETFDVRISAITVSGARQTFFCLDKNKKVLFGIPNIDDRGNHFLNQFTDQRKIVFEKTARNISGDFLAMKLVGLREVRPDLYNNVFSFTSLSELFALLFCGKLVIEPSQAAETQLFNIFDKNWDADLLKIFGMDSIFLPEIVPSQTVFPVINQKLLRKFGITNDDCKFVIGGADTQLAMKAILPESESKTLCLVSGTTSPVCVRVEKPMVKSNHWLDLDLTGKEYVLEYNPGVTGLNYERSKKLLLPESSYKEIEEHIDLAKIQNIYASFTTQTFVKEDGGKKYGGFFLSPPFTDSVSKEMFVGSIALDIGFSIAKKVNQLKKDVKVSYDSIVACGGGMNSVIIPQVVSTLTNMPVKIYENFQEPSVMGCFEVINSVLKKNLNSKDKKIRFEYYPQEKKPMEKSYETWENLNLNITRK